MKGVYLAKREHGTAVCLSYTGADRRRVREHVEFVPHGLEYAKRVQEAKRRAERKLLGYKHAIAEGENPGKAPRRKAAPTFGEYVRDVYASVLRRSSMKERPREREIQRVTTGTLGRYFAKQPVDAITRTVVEAFIDSRRAEGAQGPGINRDLARLRHLLNDIGDREELRLELPSIPWRRLLHDEDPTHYRPMRDDEELRILGQLRDAIVRAYVELLLHTGIRPEAALQLRWEHVDLRGRLVLVPREINKTHGYVVYPNTRVQEVLLALHASRPERLRAPEAQIFAHRNGNRRRSIRTAWERACQAADVEGLHVRGLRATAATRLQEGGANAFDVKMHLGHSVGSMGVTGRYLDPQAEHRRKIAELTIRHRPAPGVVELRPRGTDSSRVAKVDEAATVSPRFS